LYPSDKEIGLSRFTYDTSYIKIIGYQLHSVSVVITTVCLGNYIVRLFFLIISIPYLYLLLTVNWLRPPVIIVGPSNQTVRIGADATFECKLLTNSLQPHTQWLQHFTFNGSYRDENGLPYVNIIQVIIFLHHFSNYYQDKTCRDDYFQLFN
jgi:hypothetical protein